MWYCADVKKTSQVGSRHLSQAVLWLALWNCFRDRDSGGQSTKGTLFSSPIVTGQICLMKDGNCASRKKEAQQKHCILSTSHWRGSIWAYCMSCFHVNFSGLIKGFKHVSFSLLVSLLLLLWHRENAVSLTTNLTRMCLAGLYFSFFPSIEVQWNHYQNI